MSSAGAISIWTGTHEIEERRCFNGFARIKLLFYFLLLFFASSQVSAFTCLQPVVGSLGAFVFLRERCTTGELIGGVMIVMGLLLTVKESQIKNLTKVVSTKELN